MNLKQQKFVESYARGRSATQAAAEAGYSHKSAYSQGSRLLKNAEIQAAVQHIRDEAHSEAIADMEESLRVVSSIMRDYEKDPTVRLKAAEMILKYKEGGKVAESEHESKDKEEVGTVIFLPLVEGDSVENATAVKMPNGAVIPLSGHEHDDLLIVVDMSEKKNESLPEGKRS